MAAVQTVRLTKSVLKNKTKHVKIDYIARTNLVSVNQGT